MAETPEDRLRALEEEFTRRANNALGEVRRASRAQRDADTGAWLSAGDSLAEKAIAAATCYCCTRRCSAKGS